MPPSNYSSSSSASDSEDDRDWADWVDDGDDGDANVAGSRQPPQGASAIRYRALFPDDASKPSILRDFTTPEEALGHAKRMGCDLPAVIRSLALDPLQVIRLLNYLRRSFLEGPSVGSQLPTPASVAQLKGDEAFLNDDEQLKPVKGCENDGLLQIDFDDMVLPSDETSTGAVERAHRTRIAELEQQVAVLQLAFEDAQKRYLESVGISGAKADDDVDMAGETEAKGKAPAAAVASAAPRGPIAVSSRTHAPGTISSSSSSRPDGRDDDTHYFTSYASHDIHQIMISDSVRTLSYAQFLLHPSNAHLIKDKVVMDVGCGSGILSMLAARAGAREVIAIDASDVAHRAMDNIRENGLHNKIRVVKGKVEELDEELRPYHGKVDLLVSEWMGYFLLYESMLPSVLHARDLYLNPTTGVLAPSHCRMTLAAVSDDELLRGRQKFWSDVHGFKMSAMAKGLDAEAWTECVKKESVVSDVAAIYDLPLQIMSPRQPTFVSPFTLKVTKATEVHGFISWFDTWFTPTGRPYPASGARDMKGGEKLPLPPCRMDPIQISEIPALTSLKGSEVASHDADEASKKGGEVVSFTTGPEGLETHWKQTIFLLKESIEAEEGTVITGEIHVTESPDNSRELDVEIHYQVLDAERAEGAGEKRKKVGARMVQMFAVR